MNAFENAIAFWLLRNCDGDWEHQYGVTLSSPDARTWRLRIDLEGTEPPELAESLRGSSWTNQYETETGFTRCWIGKDLSFDAECTFGMLEHVLNDFATVVLSRWVDRDLSTPLVGETQPRTASGIDGSGLIATIESYLMDGPRVDHPVNEAALIESMDNPGWAVYINAVHSNPLARKRTHERSSVDWFTVNVDSQGVRAFGGPLNFDDLASEIGSSLSSTDDAGSSTR